MKRVVIVQARTNSSRLPGKVLMDVGGRPMLAQQLRRLKLCRNADEIVVATTLNDRDDSVVKVAEDEGVRWYRGSESDVLSRYAEAAEQSAADLVVRVTADCPLIDPDVTDTVIADLEASEGNSDYASNVHPRTYPVGLDTEAMYRDVLKRVERLGRSEESREHVTHFIVHERSDLFVLRSITDTEDNSDLRWTVDTAADLTSVRRLYDGLGLADRYVSFREVVKAVRSDPAVYR